MTARGHLRVYLGAAPGVGKTYTMLDEGQRRLKRGTDVVTGFVETHGRRLTAEALEGLEVVPRRQLHYRGAQFQEMDLDAILARAPEVALIDELAHTNIPGSRHEKRWQDVEELLETGIEVISTVNIQHLESLNDVVQAITGVPQHETVPDAMVRAAEQIELIDMTPEALRRRMSHGNIYTPDKVDAALSNYFRVGNLAALRELALLWLADSVDEGLQRYRETHGIDGTWETRERVVVALTGGPEGDALIRRAARIAARTTGGEFLAVHIARSDGLGGGGGIGALSTLRVLVESLGGSYHSVVGDDVPTALLSFAKANNATQIVIGASRRSTLLTAITGPGTGATITRKSGPIDVHIVTHDYVGGAPRLLPALTGGLTVRRRVTGLLTAVVLLPALTLLCAALAAQLSLASDLLVFLTAIVVVSLIGGFYPAVFAALFGSLLLNYYFVPPVHQFVINSPENVLALILFLVVAALVSHVVDLAARRTSQAARASAEAETLSALAGSLLRGEEALPALLERVRETFTAQSVALLRCDNQAPTSGSTSSPTHGSGLRGSWSPVASTGENPPLTPDEGETDVPVGDDLTLVLRGRSLPADDQRILTAFAAQAAVAYQQRQLLAAAAAAAPLAQTDRMRTALLNAVGHDLRTPLAIAKAAISGLRSPGIDWSTQDQVELLADADGALDRLTALLTDLLDLSRMQAGVLAIGPQVTSLADVVGTVFDHEAQARDADIEIDLPTELPEVIADPGLLDRVIANLVQNAQRYSSGVPIRLAASFYAGRVELRVVDRGPGIPDTEKESVFAPFQRRDDHSDDGAGVGLGLAIARGFTEAMSGTLTAEDTPGGGLTMVINLPAVDPTDTTTGTGTDHSHSAAYSHANASSTP